MSVGWTRSVSIMRIVGGSWPLYRRELLVAGSGGKYGRAFPALQSSSRSFQWTTPPLAEATPATTETSQPALNAEPDMEDPKGGFTTESLVKSIAEAHNLSMASSRRIVRSVTDFIMDAVAQNKSVRISQFGSFAPIMRKERQAYNPRTREPIKVPAKMAVSFRASSVFKKYLNK